VKPYSQDLRERIIAALEIGTDSQSEIAATFGVSLSFVEKLWHKWCKTGNCDALPHAGGRERSLKNDESKIRATVAAQPDLTLAELCEQVAAANGASVVPMTMCRELKRLNLPRKKSRRMPPNVTRRG
jgi:transposase